MLNQWFSFSAAHHPFLINPGMLEESGCWICDVAIVSVVIG